MIKIKFNEVTWYSKLAAIIFFLGILPTLTFYLGTRYHEVKNFDTVTIFQAEKEDNASVRKAVSKFIESEMNGKWDKKVEIEAVTFMQDAYIGKWYNKDAWPWIAFKSNDEWKVLISRDGFDCTSLKTIPEKYQDFFKVVSIDGSGKPQCYNWSLGN